MGTWIDEGQPGFRFVENERDAGRFAHYLRNDQRYGRPQWWLVTIGSMSPGARNELLDQLMWPGNTIRRFRRRDALAMSRASKEARGDLPVRKLESVGAALMAVVMTPWLLVVSTISVLARLIGRGPRRYLLHAPAVPPPMNPPSGGVREPRNPLPTSGPSTLTAEDPAIGH